jgi:hypothetical protein
MTEVDVYQGSRVGVTHAHKMGNRIFYITAAAIGIVLPIAAMLVWLITID